MVAKQFQRSKFTIKHMQASSSQDITKKYSPVFSVKLGFPKIGADMMHPKSLAP